MRKLNVSTRRSSISPVDEQRAFDRWLQANSILGMIFAALFVAMAFAGWMAERPPSAAIADSREPSSTATPKPLHTDPTDLLTIQ